MWSTIVKNDELLFLFLKQWREEVEESKGRGFKRVNKFRVAVFKQTVFALQGVQRGGRVALKTLKQFVAQAVEAGRSEAWGEQEWKRRRADPLNYESGVDPETNLEVVTGLTERYVDAFQLRGRRDEIELLQAEHKTFTSEQVATAAAELGTGFVAEGHSTLHAFNRGGAHGVGASSSSIGQPVSAQTFLQQHGQGHLALEGEASTPGSAKKRRGPDEPNMSPWESATPERVPEPSVPIDDTDLINLQEKQEKLVLQVQTRMTEELARVIEARRLGAEAENKRAFAKHKLVLDTRARCVELVLSGTREALVSHIAELVTAHAIARTEGKPVDEKQHLMPIRMEDLRNLRTIEEALDKAANLGNGSPGLSAMDVEQQRKSFTDGTLAPLQALHSLLKKSVDIMHSSHQACIRDEENKRKQAEKLRASQALKESKKKQVAPAPAQASSVSSSQAYSIFRLDLTQILDAKQFSESDRDALDYDQMLAAYSSDKVQELGAAAPLKLNYMVFRSGFAREQASPANHNLRKHMELTGSGSEAIFDSVAAWAPPRGGWFLHRHARHDSCARLWAC